MSHKHALTLVTVQLQGRRKQSADGQAQLDVGGEAANNLRTKRVAKIGPIFSSQEALSFHFSFKLGVTITLFS